jgi:hypothetical protein
MKVNISMPTCIPLSGAYLCCEPVSLIKRYTSAKTNIVQQFFEGFSSSKNVSSFIAEFIDMAINLVCRRLVLLYAILW